MKELLTPGRLYSKLIAEFRRSRCPACENRVLPTPIPVEGADGDDPTWVLGKPSWECERCAKVIAGIVRRNQAKYDLLDPVSPRVRVPRRPVVRAAHRL